MNNKIAAIINLPKAFRIQLATITLSINWQSHKYSLKLWSGFQRLQSLKSTIFSLHKAKRHLKQIQSKFPNHLQEQPNLMKKKRELMGIKVKVGSQKILGTPLIVENRKYKYRSKC